MKVVTIEIPDDSELIEVFSLRIERCIDEWGVYYGTTEDSDGSKLSTPIYGDTLLEASYEMLCYLAENNLLKK